MPLQPKLSPFTKAGFWLSLDHWVSYVNPSDAGAVLWHGPHFPWVSKPQLLHSVISSNILFAPSIYCEWPVPFSFPWFASFKLWKPYAAILPLLVKRLPWQALAVRNRMGSEDLNCFMSNYETMTDAESRCVSVQRKECIPNSLLASYPASYT